MIAYSTSFNTPFDEFSEDTQEQMNLLWAQIMAVLLTNGHPYLTTIIYLNDTFLKTYLSSNSEKEVYQKIFKHFKVPIAPKAPSASSINKQEKG